MCQAPLPTQDQWEVQRQPHACRPPGLSEPLPRLARGPYDFFLLALSITERGVCGVQSSDSGLSLKSLPQPLGYTACHLKPGEVFWQHPGV